MNLIGDGFQKLQHEQGRHSNRQTQPKALAAVFAVRGTNIHIFRSHTVVTSKAVKQVSTGRRFLAIGIDREVHCVETLSPLWHFKLKTVKPN